MSVKKPFEVRTKTLGLGKIHKPSKEDLNHNKFKKH